MRIIFVLFQNLIQKVLNNNFKYPLQCNKWTNWEKIVSFGDQNVALDHHTASVQ